MVDEVGGSGNGDKTLGVAVDQQNASANRERRRIATGACRDSVPVAEDILETNAAGQSLVERSDRNQGDLADEIGVADGIRLVARDNAGDAAAGGANDGNAACDRYKYGDRDRYGKACRMRDALQQESLDREHAERQNDQDQERQAPGIDPEQQAAKAVVAIGFDSHVFAEEFAD